MFPTLCIHIDNYLQFIDIQLEASRLRRALCRSMDAEKSGSASVRQLINGSVVSPPVMSLDILPFLVTIIYTTPDTSE